MFPTGRSLTVVWWTAHNITIVSDQIWSADRSILTGNVAWYVTLTLWTELGVIGHKDRDTLWIYTDVWYSVVPDYHFIGITDSGQTTLYDEQIHSADIIKSAPSSLPTHHHHGDEIDHRRNIRRPSPRIRPNFHPSIQRVILRIKMSHVCRRHRLTLLPPRIFVFS